MCAPAGRPVLAVAHAAHELVFALHAGCVLKVDDQELAVQLGAKQADPLWAVAWKFPPMETTTRILGINLTIGKQGKVSASNFSQQRLVHNS